MHTVRWSIHNSPWIVYQWPRLHMTLMCITYHVKKMHPQTVRSIRSTLSLTSMKDRYITSMKSWNGTSAIYVWHTPDHCFTLMMWAMCYIGDVHHILQQEILRHICREQHTSRSSISPLSFTKSHVSCLNSPLCWPLPTPAFCVSWYSCSLSAGVSFLLRPKQQSIRQSQSRADLWSVSWSSQ